MNSSVSIPFIIISFLVFLALAWLVYRYIATVRRNRLLAETLSPEQIEILENNVPLYRRLPEALQITLQGSIRYFLKDKVFVACEGLTLSNEMRLIIAANACMLVVNRKRKYFSGFKSILLYPDTYVANQIRYEGLVAVHGKSTRAGESWHRGPVVLSLGDVMRGTRNDEDGHNVVLHEFAHKLDEENGIMDGLPVLRDRSHYKEWAEVLTEEFDEFRDRVGQGRNTVIDGYGAVSAVEFFAVATESFFEKSSQMKRKLPELYQQLQTFYGLDPAEW